MRVFCCLHNDVRMSALDTPPLRRRAFWADIRFVLGVVLITASILGVWLVVSAAGRTVPVLAAAGTIVPGDSITTDDLRTVEVAWSTVGETYLTPGELIEGRVATRTIAEGELVPLAALEDATAISVATVVVRSATDVPAAVSPGSGVEVWVTPIDAEGPAVPRILVADATIAAISRDSSMLGGAAASLELVIPRSDIAAVLGAIADKATLSVVPSGGAR